MLCLRFCAVACLLVVFSQPSWAENRPRYEALLADGTRLEGSRLQEWHNAAARPKLDDRELLSPANPMLWLRDRTLRPADPPAAFVEMLSGDRLPGTATEFRPAGVVARRSLPAHFVVRPETRLTHPEDTGGGDLRVVERYVRRIVWQRRPGLADRYEPGMVFFRDGRSLKFRVARFETTGIRLLLEDGSRRIAYADIAELHLPQKDPWPSYYEELAALDPSLQARLLQIETTGGLRATGSLNRFDAREGSQGKDSERWLHALQPAWSLGLIWIPHRTVIVYRSFAAHQVPLSRIMPTKALLSGMLGSGQWHWQVNRNVQGGPLTSGGQSGGWGLGVHAQAELYFPLPPLARSFRARFGLDDCVGAGGCVRVRVFLGSTGDKPLFESPVIVGAEKSHETGVLAIAQNLSVPTLILQVDAAHNDRPPGADPLDVRDVCNWIDPLLELDSVALKAEVDKRRLLGIAAWEGWEVSSQGDGTIRLSDFREDQGPEKGLFVTEMAAEKQPFSLRRTVQVEPNHHWLLLGCSVRSDFSEKIKLQLRVAGEPMAEFVVPVGDARQNQTLAFPLEPFVGQRVSFEIVQQPGDGRLNVWWRQLALAEQLPRVYRAFDEEGSFVALEGDKKPELIDNDHYTGKKCMKLPGGGRYRFHLPAPCAVRAEPRQDEFRMLRMALRKVGGGRIGLSFEPETPEKPVMLDLGKGPPVAPHAQRVAPDPLGSDWFVFTRDLVAHVGERNITGIVFDVPDGEYLLVDHIYFVNWHDDFRWLPPDPPWQAVHSEHRKKSIDGLRQNTQANIVRVEVDGRAATGTIMNEGFVLTAGHVLGKPGREATVTLADGRKAPATTAGVDRANNLGLIKLKDNPNIRGPEVRDWQEGHERYLFVGWWHDPADTEAKPQMAPIIVWRAFFGSVWTDPLPTSALSGAPLFDSDGFVIGILTRRSRFGGTLYSKTKSVQENWDRLKKGETWGQWLRGAGPSLGIPFAANDDCRVGELPASTPHKELRTGDVIVACDGQPVDRPSDIDRLLISKDPGDEVPLDLRRGKSTLTVKVVVQARRA